MSVGAHGAEYSEESTNALPTGIRPQTTIRVMDFGALLPGLRRYILYSACIPELYHDPARRAPS